MTKLVVLFILISSLPNALDFEQDTTYRRLLTDLKSARELKENDRLAEAYFNLGKYEENVLKDENEAFDYYLRSKEYFLRTNKINRVNDINRIIAKKYAKSGFNIEALEFYENLIEYYKKENDLNKLAYIYFETGLVYKEKGEEDKALNYFNKSVEINGELKDTSLLIDFNFERIRSHLVIKEIDKAKELALKNLDLALNKRNKSKVIRSYIDLSEIYSKSKDYYESNWYANKALNLISLKGFDQERSTLYNVLADNYERQNDFKNAFQFKNQHSKLQDSIFRNEKNNAINDLALKHQLDQKQKDIKLLELENKSVLTKFSLTKNSLYLLTLGCLALLAILYIVVQFFRQKIQTENIISTQKHEIDSQKIRELEDNLKISSMQSMLMGQEKERERIATDLHDSLGGLLSAVKLQFDHFRTKMNGSIHVDQYEKATNLLDTAVSEVRNISRNLQPTALKNLGLISAIKDLINRFDGEKAPEIFFQYYNLDGKIDEMMALNIYRIIQELLNNTIKHANASEVLLQITRESEEITIEYEDDGIGIDMNGKKGMGLDNIQYRVNYLKGNISIDTQHNNGVSFLIRIPYNKNYVTTV
jgi:signal transduction histidine kinase/tetratricopeptide (TPR) repeat protein